MGLILISPIFNFKTKDNFYLPEAQASFLPTSVIITVCGNDVLDTGETCDDGINNGVYSLSISQKYCNATCDGWTPYCGNSTVESNYEECDDGNNTSGDGCSSICKNETTSGGGGGGGVFIPPSISTKVVLIGKAYPGSDINVLMDGKLVKMVKADSEANFRAEVEDITSGVSSFSIWAVDKYGGRSIAYSFTSYITENTITTLSGVYLPPTIDVNKTSLQKGEILDIFGQTIPEVEISVYVFSEEIIATTTSDEIGAWLYKFNTKVLEEGSHTAKAMSKITPYEKSGFSQVLVFNVGKGIVPGMNTICPYADLNKDGNTNLVDFSILLYWWNKESAPADQNMNGIVDLADFSIMLYYWTG